MAQWWKSSRSYSYREGQTRLGFVGLSRPGIKPVIYSWFVDDGKGTGGQASTLLAAKRKVEKHSNKPIVGA